VDVFDVVGVSSRKRV